MKSYHKTEDYKLYKGNVLDMLEVIEKESIDSIITDPPYGLTSITKRFSKDNASPAKFGKDGAFSRLSKGFMGKEWDGSGVECNVETWKRCYDVLKDGGYLLAFGGSRTYHRIACAIEDAGFEIRDCIMWLYGTGFPKSTDIGLMIDKHNGVESKVVGVKTEGTSSSLSGIWNFNKEGDNSMQKEFQVKDARNEWGGWKTALKPAYEPIIVARKPIKITLIENVQINRVGALNIKDCKIETERDTRRNKGGIKDKYVGGKLKKNYNQFEHREDGRRYPANVILDDSKEVKDCFYNNENRFFYCAKATRKDRDEGLDEFETTQITDGSVRGNSETAGAYGANPAKKKNIHPTVKPTELIQYLVKLVNAKGATILDPFMGSGSTGKAVMYENMERNMEYKFIGIDITEDYLPIAKARIDYARNKTTQTSFL